MKNLTESKVTRLNILNNQFTVFEIQNQLNIEGINLKEEILWTKELIAEFFEVDIRTIERYISKYKDELEKNGYKVLRGKQLKILKEELIDSFGTDNIVGTKVNVLGIFTFRAFLNMAMLLTESKKAKNLRSVILDISIDVVNKKTGGRTKYINQRDEIFLMSWYDEENYRKEFTDALKKYVDMGNIKYAIYTNKIYQSIFKEKADEYRKILRLHKNDRIRDTLYSEVLDLISSYESGIAYEIEKLSEELNRRIKPKEVDEIFEKFHMHPSNKPLLNKARNKMASRDLAFRDALHLQLQEYITPLNQIEFEKFLGEKSKELKDRLEEAKEVFKRLKEY
ncbi:MAG TPA: DNA-binding protein [Anaerovoracaceae bacterium]|nr:DNA-binding protein [Anaerovoracaceae bacterium]